jgi:Family of unknown function (DUF5319)
LVAQKLAPLAVSVLPWGREPPRGVRTMNVDEGPQDPFFGDPDDPAALLDDHEPPQPLTDDERRDVLADLAELTEFRSTLAPQGVDGIVVDCADCGEQHYFGWDLMAANLRALLGEGRTHVHEPAFAPDPNAYVSWDYARGYTDAVQTLSKRR